MPYDPAAVRNAYNAIADTEEGLEKGFSLRNEIPREFIRKYLRSTDVVLDAGGGAGLNSIMMAQRCQKVTLLDLSPELLKRAMRNIQDQGCMEKIEVCEGDITDLSHFEDGSFSFVVCVGGTLSYTLEKAEQAVKELLRVAKIGSIIIIGCDSKYGFIRSLFHQLGTDEQLEVSVELLEAGQYEAGEGAFARLFTAGELTSLLRNAGCEILEVGSAPVLMSSWEQSSYPPEKQQQLKELELKLCTLPELWGAGHHLFCIARRSSG